MNKDNVDLDIVIEDIQIVPSRTENKMNGNARHTGKKPRETC